jgi:endonuclease YncB( thermonuclease family)
MNRRPAPPPQKPSGNARPSRSALTRTQKLVIFLAGLLLVAWVVVAVIFIRSAGPASLISGAAKKTQPVSQPAQPAPATPGASPTAEIIQVSAACAQRSAGVEQGTVVSVDEQGILAVTTSSGQIHVGLAGIMLPSTGQPAQKALRTLQEMVLNQPVLLARDPADLAEAGASARYVFTTQMFVNDELVRQGLAVVDPEAAEQACGAVFQLSEQKSRGARLGLWEPTRVPTRTFVPFVTLDNSQNPACDCSKRYECSDFPTHDQAQACYNACNDYNSRLDLDRNGIACEELP